MSPVVAILSYHKIGCHRPDGWPTWNYTGTDEFSAQLEWFHRGGWKFLSALEFLSALNGHGVISEKGVLITFDDAYKSLLENALPVLNRFSAPSVVFVPTQFVGNTNLFDNGIEPLEPISCWNTLAALEEGGMTVESHGCSHRGFSSLSPLEIQQELAFSKEAIRKNLGKDSRMFAFPYGDFGADRVKVDSAIRLAGYEVAFLYGGGPFELAQKPVPLFLPRLAMGPGVNLEEMLLEVSCC